LLPLAQSTLGRLLDIYQQSDGGKESSLTRFVKDLLGIDILETLIAGLHHTTDKRRLKKLLPEYRGADHEHQELLAQIGRHDEMILVIEEAVDEMRSDLATHISRLTTGTIAVEDLSAIADLCANDVEERRLVELTQARRELLGLESQWRAIEREPSTIAIVQLEAVELASRTAVERWSSSAGKILERTYLRAHTIFPDLPNWQDQDPATACGRALSRTVAERHRCASLVTSDEQRTVDSEKVSAIVASSRQRVVAIDSQMAQLIGDASGLARALAGIVPHIHDASCPVVRETLVRSRVSRLLRLCRGGWHS